MKMIKLACFRWYGIGKPCTNAEDNSYWQIPPAWLVYTVFNDQALQISTDLPIVETRKCGMSK